MASRTTRAPGPTTRPRRTLQHDREVDTSMSTAAILIARIRNRERVMANIQERNPHTYRDNHFYHSLHTAVVAYRDALHHLERVGVREDVAEVATVTA